MASLAERQIGQFAKIVFHGWLLSPGWSMYAGFKNILESISMETVALTNVARCSILTPNNQPHPYLISAQPRSMSQAGYSIQQDPCFDLVNRKYKWETLRFGGFKTLDTPVENYYHQILPELWKCSLQGLCHGENIQCPSIEYSEDSYSKVAAGVFFLTESVIKERNASMFFW